MISDLAVRPNAVSGLLGSAMSRFEAAMSNLQLGAASFRDAEARIRDADVAEESARLVRSQILQRAGTAVLARANQEPAMALRLLA
jgi:flagellin